MLGGRIWATQGSGTFSNEIQRHPPGQGVSGPEDDLPKAQEARVDSLPAPVGLLRSRAWGRDISGETNWENGCVQMRQTHAHRQRQPGVIPPALSGLCVLGPLHERLAQGIP